jgi:TolA-binding protein
MAYHGKGSRRLAALIACRPRARLLAALAALSLAAVLPAQEGGSDLASGIALFKSGQFDKAIALFQAVLLTSTSDAQKSEAILWTAKSSLALNKLDDAAKNIELYLAGYPNAPDRAEALYTKGRVLFLQEEYESSIQVLQGFIAKYPQSPFVSNAYFWVGECLYNLGKLDEAVTVYRTILRDYPTSFKVEAAQYRIALIDVARREVELSKLLKWSHEDFLRSIADYQRREKTYEQAIEAYQKRLGVNETAQYQLTIADLKKQLDAKAGEAENLGARIAALNAQIGELKAQAAEAEARAAEKPAAAEEPGEETAQQKQAVERTLKLLAIKERALSLKAAYLDWLAANGGGQ